MNKVLHSSKSNEWETPQDLFNRLDNEFHFTLDPCCTHENAKCETHFTIAGNGLEQLWAPDVVFMNPPYGRQIKHWIEKAFTESQAGALVVCLVPARTDTAWWHDYVIGKDAEIRFLRGRLKFSNAKNNAPFPSAIVIFR